MANTAPPASGVAPRVLAWYARNRRRLPWRSSRDPYRIWVSEIMLQQTQVDTVIPYYRRWLARFPSLRALARAPEQDVLSAWEGLGYYARARHLRQAARQVMAEGGRLPRTVEGWRQLPGVGRYTAAAIASIAFGQRAAVLDGNVKRVLARVSDFRQDVKSAQGESALWALAESLLPRADAGDYNQAMMELGATVCRPRSPACDACPLSDLCAARRLGVQEARPVKGRRRPVPLRVLAAVVLQERGRVLLARRAPEGLLGGLWAFPAGLVEAGETLPEAARRCAREALGLRVAPGEEKLVVEQVYSHFRARVHVFLCRRAGGRLPRGAASWVLLSCLPAHPMGKMDRQIARWLASSAGASAGQGRK
jgi:A/G-specific adenine glycosylase